MDASLFAFVSHSKKRPNNLILGRFFNNQLLDMIELGITNYTPMTTQSRYQAAIGSKPCFIFVGEEFEQNQRYTKLQNLILDTFRGTTMSHVNLVGLDHVIVISVVEGIVQFRRYAVILKKSGSKIPRVELEEIGPTFDMTLRRHNFAPNDLMKETLKVSKEILPKKVKNIRKTKFGPSGKIHMEKQDLTKLATRKMKGLKRKREHVDD